MPDYGVNYLAVLVAAGANQVFGYLWYGPIFGKAWFAALGKTREEMGSPTFGIIVSIIASLVSALGLALVLNLVPNPGITEGIVWGAIIGIAFVATAIATIGTFEGRNARLMQFSVFYQVLGFVLMGAILGAWR